MLDYVLQFCPVTKRVCYIFFGLSILVICFEYDNELQDFTPVRSLLAGLMNNQSRMIMCSGSFYSSLYVITSCRCFHSSIAIYPFHKERNASQYRVSVEPDERTILEISHFVTHPFCMKNKVKKPYKNHFGLIVLSKPFLISQVVPPLTTTSDIEYTRSEIINLSSKFTMCEVYGHHLDSGEIRVGSTKMILMKSEDCLLRLCIPKIGCKGKKSKITHGEDFCLKVPGDIRLDARFFEGSLVKCGGHVLGLVVSPGSPRYPKVPTIFASVTQYLRNFPSPNV